MGRENLQATQKQTSLKKVKNLEEAYQFLESNPDFDDIRIDGLNQRLERIKKGELKNLTKKREIRRYNGYRVIHLDLIQTPQKKYWQQ